MTQKATGRHDETQEDTTALMGRGRRMGDADRRLEGDEKPQCTTGQAAGREHVCENPSGQRQGACPVTIRSNSSRL